INDAFFYTQINNAVYPDTIGGHWFFRNANQPIITKGMDTYVRITSDELEIYLGYTFTIAEQKYTPQLPHVPLTPKNRFGGVATYKLEDKWRFGLETSYNGEQYRYEEKKTQVFFLIAKMIEKKFRHVSIVLNGKIFLENRQSRVEPIVFPPYNSP